ncbi:OLC1v1036679C1 [Oldenlandia corymbosa var. corymbosa]|uniref:OLC1v1036679C1 n=1 Tax=Oldenlandia corymbosa var. corymbosa TaxID=529605 RepID=A0AAV1CX22_OLDCO|nr:OLC1v1036679C1 [Oldenlandia corymbosa var. corymbosa]
MIVCFALCSVRSYLVVIVHVFQPDNQRYCECYAYGSYCDGCSCENCYNNVENEGARREAVKITLERNPNAFTPRISSSFGAQEVTRKRVVVQRLHGGCRCKNTRWLEKYYECFQVNKVCYDLCKCESCKNFEGSEERRQALFWGNQYHANINIPYIQQAANVDVTAAMEVMEIGQERSSNLRDN